MISLYELLVLSFFLRCYSSNPWPLKCSAGEQYGHMSIHIFHSFFLYSFIIYTSCIPHISMYLHTYLSSLSSICLSSHLSMNEYIILQPSLVSSFCSSFRYNLPYTENTSGISSTQSQMDIYSVQCYLENCFYIYN